MINYEDHADPGSFSKHREEWLRKDLNDHNKEQIIDAYVELMEAYCEELSESKDAKDLIEIIKRMVIS